MTEIPQSELDSLKKLVPMAELVRSRGVELKAVGKDLKGLCPFHDEKTASFSVTPDKELYHCFGCGRGGDVFSFVMESDSVDFPEAVRRIKLFGEGHSGKAEKFDKIKLFVNDRILLEQVTEHYHRQFLEAPRAIDYLKKRGIVDPETIKALHPIFFDESFSKMIPQARTQIGKEMRGKLSDLGILHKSGREAFVGYLAFPAYDDGGGVAQLVARKIHNNPDGRSRYLLLSRPHAGIFNRPALEHQKQIILTEGIMDCLTFYEHGFRNVTCGFGSNGFHEDLFLAITQSKVETVYIAYDNDESGNAGAQRVAEKLAASGIGSYRVSFPKGVDANAYALKTTPARHALTVLINSAQWMGKGKVTKPMLAGSLASVSGNLNTEENENKNNQLNEGQLNNHSNKVSQNEKSKTAPTIESVKAKHETPVKLLEGDICELSFGGRLYRVFGLSKNNTLEVMKVNIRVYIDEGYFSETIDLASNKQKDRYATDAAEALRDKTETFKRDLERMFLKLEDVQYERIYGEENKKNKRVEISDEDKKEAFRFLKSKRMFKEIEEHFAQCGVVGEENNLLVMYLAATSRLLKKPIHILIQSGSASGKSTLMKATLDMMPPEDVNLYAALTGQVLFYMQNLDLKHKIIAIEEDMGAEKASYALKVLQSAGKVSIASTIKDPSTGMMSAGEFMIEGPISTWQTSTSLWIEEEIQNRHLILTTDESREQTERILEMQRVMETMDGWDMRDERKHIQELHHNAQRLLRPLAIVNPYARQLEFLSNQHRLRRDHEKYMALIRTVALLRQYQKPILKRIRDCKEEDHIEIDLKDIRIANRLANYVLGRSLDDLPPHSRHFLINIHELAVIEAKRLKVDRKDVRLTRRLMAEHTGLSTVMVHKHLSKLSEMEYVVGYSAKQQHSRMLVYEIIYRGEGKSGKPFLPGIANVKELKKELAQKENTDKQIQTLKAEIATRPAVVKMGAGV